MGHSSSEYEIDPNDVEEDEHDERQGEIRVRVERKKTTVQVPGMYNFTAEDDGGLCWMDRQVHGWGMGLPTLAFLEAKRAFKFIHIDERMGEYQPIVSKGTLAQYLGEAIVT
ncbi:hypothetical protein AlacWU_06084 [Aspergillus niger]|nr:hypothetical protein AlacWU_06084 [Aspergillus niger]